MKQYEQVIAVMEENGGWATLGFLYHKVDSSGWKTKTPFASIRRIVQDERFFFKIKVGLWGLKSDQKLLLEKFGLNISKEKEREEMYQMFSNVFSIAPDVVVTERNFTRLNEWLQANGFTVERIPYAEISKQEGLLRCSTLPLLRD